MQTTRAAPMTEAAEVADVAHDVAATFERIDLHEDACVSQEDRYRLAIELQPDQARELKQLQRKTRVWRLVAELSLDKAIYARLGTIRYFDCVARRE